ncbi:MAG: CAP domain-containing protein [Bacteroidetes bacterium]|nr:CAP domain-containing protein [Bacteroidota bacterium]
MKIKTIIIVILLTLNVNQIAAQTRQKQPKNKPKTQQQIQNEIRNANKIYQQELDDLKEQIDLIRQDRKRMLDSVDNVKKQLQDTLDSMKKEVNRMQKLQYLILEDLKKNSNRDSVKKVKDGAFNRVNKMPEKEFREKLRTNVRKLCEWEVKALMLRRLNEMRAEVNKLDGKYYDTEIKEYRCAVTSDIVDKNAKPSDRFRKLNPLKYDDVLDRCATIFVIAKQPYPWCYPENAEERKSRGLTCAYPEHNWVSIPFPYDMFDKVKTSWRKSIKDGDMNPDVCMAAKQLFLGEDWAVGENSIVDRETVEKALIDWNNSPGHARNMYLNRYTHIGFGYDHNCSRMVQNLGYKF